MSGLSSDFKRDNDEKLEKVQQMAIRMLSMLENSTFGEKFEEIV